VILSVVPISFLRLSIFLKGEGPKAQTIEIQDAIFLKVHSFKAPKWEDLELAATSVAAFTKVKTKYDDAKTKIRSMALLTQFMINIVMSSFSQDTALNCHIPTNGNIPMQRQHRQHGHILILGKLPPCNLILLDSSK
jgi:hypothetical protein